MFLDVTLSNYFYDGIKIDPTLLYVQIFVFSSMTIAFLLGLFGAAASHGRFHKTNRKSFMVSDEIAWIFQESPNLIITLFYLIKAIIFDTKQNKINIFLICLYFLHYIHRTLIFPIILSEKKTKKKWPFEIMILAFIFCICNGFMQNRSILINAEYPEGYLMKTNVILGVFVFLIGMFINIYHDYRILYLKRNNIGNIDGYVVPTGGLYEFISAPNYLGEIIEWVGFAIACNTSSAWLFAYTTFCAIFPRGLNYHKWYIEKFGNNYPKHRMAIIPYVI